MLRGHDYYETSDFIVRFYRSIFTEEKCMLLKLNYFKRKEERNVYKNHFVRSYEIEKEDLSV